MHGLQSSGIPQQCSREVVAETHRSRVLLKGNPDERLQSLRSGLINSHLCQRTVALSARNIQLQRIVGMVVTTTTTLIYQLRPLYSFTL